MAEPRIDIVMPGLLGPFPRHSELPDEDALHQLVSVLGNDPKEAFNGYVEQIAGCLDQASIPMAALSLYATRPDFGSAYCMHLEPVHLKADMDHAILVDQRMFDLDRDDRRELFHVLHDHFEQDDIRLVHDDDDNWYVIGNEPFGISTVHIDRVAARNINFFLPEGDTALLWRKFLNEAQMLLHDSEVNLQRAQSGLLPVNSVWLWGEGSTVQDYLDENSATGYNLIIGDTMLHRGLASALGIPFVQRNDEDSLRRYRDRSVLLFDTSFEAATAHGDITQWLRILEHRLDALLLPMARDVHRDGIRTTIMPCNGKQYRIGHQGFLRKLFSRASPHKVLSFDD